MLHLEGECRDPTSRGVRRVCATTSKSEKIYCMITIVSVQDLPSFVSVAYQSNPRGEGIAEKCRVHYLPELSRFEEEWRML